MPSLDLCLDISSTEHEISTAHKNQNAEKIKTFFLLSISHILYLSCL